MYEHIVEGAAKPSQQNKTDHLQPQHPYQVQVGPAPAVDAKDTVIHNPAHESRLQQIHHHLANHEQACDDGKEQILSDIFPHGQRPPCPFEPPWCP